MFAGDIELQTTQCWRYGFSRLRHQSKRTSACGDASALYRPYVLFARGNSARLAFLTFRHRPIRNGSFYRSVIIAGSTLSGYISLDVDEGSGCFCAEFRASCSRCCHLSIVRQLVIQPIQSFQPTAGLLRYTVHAIVDL